MLQFGMIAAKARIRSGRSNTICLLLPNLCLGGAEKVTVHLANGLAQRGYQVDMVLFEAEGEFLGDLSRDIRLVDLKARRMVWAISRFAKYLRREKPAVAISALDYVNIGAIVSKCGACRAPRCPWSRTIHSTRSMSTQYKLDREGYLAWSSGNGAIAARGTSSASHRVWPTTSWKRRARNAIGCAWSTTPSSASGRWKWPASRSPIHGSRPGLRRWCWQPGGYRR